MPLLIKDSLIAGVKLEGRKPKKTVLKGGNYF